MTETDRDTDRSGASLIGAVVGMLGLVAAVTVGALAVGSSDPAAASGLQQFDSCEELQAWTEELQVPELTEDEAFTTAEDSAAPTGAAAESSDRVQSTTAEIGGDGGTGGTNTVVEGVDEIDVIDRISDDRVLISRNGALALVDLTSRTVVAELAGIPYDARISAADGVVFVAGTANSGVGLEVRRVLVDGDSLTEDGSWSAPGYLLDARRTSDRLYIVAIDDPYDGVAVPFEDGPVPCDQVWRPVDPASTPSATLVASLPATGELAPTAATEVAGSAGNLLVTDSSVYVATESWTEDGTVSTGLHRFAVDTLTPTGSGVVPGAVAGPFALSEHEGTIRVATTAGSGGFIVGPLPAEGDVIIDEAPILPAIDPAADDAVGRSAPVQGGADIAIAPDQVETEPPTEPDGTTTTIPVEPTTTAPETTTTTVPETTTTTVPETTTTTVAEDPAALAEVFVLDTEGDLDLLGRTGRFGTDYETIQGVRFVGEFAYVVTFRQTDPFWVIDLADPAAPAVVGELQIPGFSGYLHPLADGRVVGFGPDGNGSMAARLFDVSDPAAPSLLDELRLGDDTPVAYDYHAFVDLEGERFAVPVIDYPEYIAQDCGLEPSLPVPGLPIPIEPGIGDGSSSSSGATGIAVGEPVPICEVAVGGGNGAAVLEVSGNRLSLVERPLVENPDIYAERVILAPDGTWFVLSWDRLAGSDGSEIPLPVS